ncbi:MAG: class I SAM-dependent methyltransferase [Gemmatimonadetes bacterium]|nr:class I SAM-dependent methyltransferase [Gemmatimonadota bacterium]
MARPVSPAPVDDRIAHNVQAYDTVARTYDAEHPEIFNDVEQARLAQAARDAVALCATSAPVRALDVGSGTGNLTAQLLAAGATVVSADISTECLRLVSERFESTGRHRTQQIDGRSLAIFADGSFDLVACYSVLHHVPDYLSLVEEMARVVRPGGVLYIDHERHDASWHDPVRDQFMREARAFPPKHWSRFFRPYNYWKRIRPLFVWQRWFDRRWMPEGDLHIWPDDHIEWAKVEARAQAHGVTRVAVRDYLLYDEHFDRGVWERWQGRLTDYRMWVGRKA